MPHFEDSIINENVSVATEYFRTLVASNIKDAQNNQKQSAGSIGFIPYNVSFTMDGISGIKIYNELHIDTNFLPNGYTKTTDFIVTGIDHSLQNGDWETNINLTLIPKTSPITNVITSSLTFAAQAEEARVDTPPSSPTPITSSPPPSGNNPSFSVTQQADDKILIRGTYTVPPGTKERADALHSFERRNSDGFGGKMSTKISEQLKILYNKKINPDVLSLKIEVNSTEYKVDWEAIVGPSNDGKAYLGISTVGSAGGGADARALSQVPSMKKWVSGAKDYTLILDFKNPTGVYIRQYFYKYTKPTKFPPY